MKKNKIIFIVPVFVVLLVVFIFKISKTGSVKYQTSSIKKQDIELTVKVDGKVESDKKSQLSFKTIGRITYLPFKKGDSVKKGQLVASIDSKSVSLEKDLALKDYMSTRVNFDQANDDYDVKKGTPLDQNVLTDEQKRILQQSQFDLDKSVARVEIANQSLSDTSIYAPFDGVISEINGEIGSITGPSIPTIVVSQTGKLKITANVSEAEIINVNKGDSVSLSFDALPNQKFAGKVERIDSSETVVSGVVFYQITILSEEIPKEIRSGMSVTCIVETQKKENVLAVPIRLISDYENDKGKLNLLENNKPVLKDIEFGIRGDGAVVEVVSGAKEGDLVIEPKI